jgi:glycosyltransferase involved in cell wall biosynthesis
MDRIIMLGHKRIPSREGGVEIVVEKLAVRMARKGKQVTVYNRSGHHVSGSTYDNFEYQKKFTYQGVSVVTIPTVDKKSLNAVVYSFLGALRAAFSDAQLVHFHAEGPCAMMWIPKLAGKKCVATIHGLDWKRDKWGGFATRFLLYGERQAVRHADRIIVLSKGVQDYFKTTYHRDTVFIPNGIDKPQKKEPEMIKKDYGLKGDDYILFLARLVPEKGVHTLLEAYEQSGLSTKLVIAGGSSHTDEYEKKIRVMAENINAKGTGQVILTGFVQGRVLQELYSNCLLYVLPSEVEGMPLSLLEAMSYGRICLTSDIPENTDITGEHGLSFVVGDTQDLCRKLQDTLSRIEELRNREEYREEGIRHYVLDNYNWDKITARTWECYESIDRQ